MKRWIKVVAVLSGLVVAGNMAYASLNPVVASESGCGDWCPNYTYCSLPCYI